MRGPALNSNFIALQALKAKTPFKMKATLFGPSVDSPLHGLHHQKQHTITKELQQSVTSIEINTWFGAFVLNQTSLHLMTQTWNLRKHSAYKERRPCIYKNKDGKHLQKVQDMLKQM